MSIREVFQRLVEFGCRAVPTACECAAIIPDPSCTSCDGNGEHVCICVGLPTPDGQPCPICNGTSISRCARCSLVPRPDPECVSCMGTGCRRSEPMDASVAALVGAGMMDLLLDLRRHEAFHLYDEALDLYQAYILRVRELEAAKHPEQLLDGIRIMAEVVRGESDNRDRVASPAAPTFGRLTPQEQFELLGEAPEGSVVCRNCGEHTFGFFADGPLDWIQGDRVACCSNDACLAAWDDAYGLFKSL